MTVRVTFHQTCDRCESPFVERQLKAGEKVPTLKSKGIVIYQTNTVDGETEQAAKPTVAFNDLCEKCSGVVEKALTSMAPPGTKPKAKTGKKRGRPSKAEIAAREAAKEKAKEEPANKAEPEAKAKAEPKEAPKVEEYSEPDPEPEGEVDLGLASDGMEIGETEGTSETEAAAPSTPTASDDPFADRETFEDPDTGDIRDVHTGEILEKREPSVGVASGDHPF